MKTQTFFPLPNKNKKIEKIDYSQIMYLQGSINYTLIHLQNGDVKLSPRTLLFHINNSLNESFIRIHRAFCVNKSFIHSYDAKENPKYLMLESGVQLAVSRRKMKVLEEI